MRTPATLVSLLFTACSILPAPEDPKDFTVQQEADRVIHEIARIRDLSAKQPVPAGEKATDELRDVMQREITKEWEENHGFARERALKQFGLLPAEFDMRTFSTDLMTSQVAGYYDPEKDEFFMVRRGEKEASRARTGIEALADFDAALTMPHELTHALEDQHFDLQAKQEAMEFDDDRGAAMLSLIEGSAMEGGAEHVLDRIGIPISTTGPVARTIIAAIGGADAGDMSAVDVDELDEEAADSVKKMQETPPILGRPLLFSYLAGWRFVNRVRSEYGWNAVNEMYSSPPDSTEQIVHPERYFDRRDKPVTVTLASPPSGYEAAFEQTMGYASLRILLSHYLDEDRTDGQVDGAEAAEGWDGDRYVLWSRATSDAVAWVIVFDHEGQAEEFANTWRKILKQRFGTANTWAVQQNGLTVASAWSLSDGEGESTVSRLLAESKVVVAEGDETPDRWYWDVLRFPIALQFFDRSWQWNVLGGNAVHYRNHDEGHRFHLLSGLGLESESNRDRNAFWCGLGLVGFHHDRTLDATFWRIPFVHNGHVRGEEDQYRSQYGLALDALLYSNVHGKKHVSLLWDLVLEINWGELKKNDRRVRFLMIPLW